MTAERRTSDYRDISMPNFRAFPDFIPVVGLVTYVERVRRASGESHREMAVNTLRPENVISMGTKDWPQPKNWKDFLRQTQTSARNVAFVAYHMTPFLVPAVIERLA